NITDFAPPQSAGNSTHPIASNDTDRGDTYQPQFVPDMSSNFKRDSHQYTKGSYSEYRGSHDYARNLRIQQFNEGYRPEARNSTSDQSTLQTRTGSASYRDGLPTHHTRGGDDDYDTNSVVSSIYSQPSAMAAHSDRASHVHDFSSETDRHNRTRDQAVPNEEEKPYAYDRRGYEDAGHYEQTHSYEDYQKRRNISTSAAEPEQQLYEAGYEGDYPYNVNEEQPVEGGYYGENYRPVDLY
ncbi:6089_t:CDS:2, partial [Paraglomus occultum]